MQATHMQTRAPRQQQRLHTACCTGLSAEHKQPQSVDLQEFQRGRGAAECTEEQRISRMHRKHRGTEDQQNAVLCGMHRGFAGELAWGVAAECTEEQGTSREDRGFAGASVFRIRSRIHGGFSSDRRAVDGGAAPPLTASQQWGTNSGAA
eukprot:1138065-Pelagomonas_calceolata.AAC.2